MVYCSHKFLRTCVRARFPKEDDAPMTRRISLRRLVAALLALVLVLSLTPAALASASCPQCGGETVCTDNGDGRTHTVSCPEDGYSDLAAPHDFTDTGCCSACGAIDYSKVHITLPSDTAFTAAMGDSDAAISLDGVTLTLGKSNEDVTGEYTLSYSWYYNGTSISTGQRCPLPPSVTSKEGDYSFVCFVTAVPGNAVAGKTISASCTVKVHVQDLLSAEAVIGSRDLYLSLGDSTGRTPVSVADQIIQAVKDAGGEASYVVFDKKPSSAAGDLKVTPGERYSLADGEGTPLSQVRFEPDSAGAYAIGFTAYDQEGTAYPGLLTIAVEQDLGSVDVLYTTVKGDPVTLSAQDFAAFWQTAYPRGKLTLVRFTSLPAASSGTLRQGYLSAARPGTPVSEDESCYVSAGGSDHALLDEVAFVPDSRFTGSVSIPFEAYGSDGNGNQVYRSGRLFLFVNPKEVQAVSCSVAEDSATKLSAGMLQQAMKKVLDEMQKGVTGHKTKLHHGKQTLRQLMKHNTGVSNIEITDQNIRAFSATAKKYGIDFALKKDTSGDIPRYLVFFKGRDADVITAAFREFSAKNLEKEKKPSIRKELEQAKQQAKAQHRQREKVKTKDRGVEL